MKLRLVTNKDFEERSLELMIDRALEESRVILQSYLESEGQCTKEGDHGECPECLAMDYLKKYEYNKEEARLVG